MRKQITTFLFLLSFIPALAFAAPNFDEVKAQAEQGDALAQTQLGLMYHQGKGVGQDYKKAAEWISKAAKQDYIDAEVLLAGMYDLGLGLPQSAREGTKWYKKAASQGHEQSAGILNYYQDETQRAMMAMKIAGQYARKLLK